MDNYDLEDTSIEIHWYLIGIHNGSDPLISFKIHWYHLRSIDIHQSYPSVSFDFLLVISIWVGCSNVISNIYHRSIIWLLYIIWYQKIDIVILWIYHNRFYRSWFRLLYLIACGRCPQQAPTWTAGNCTFQEGAIPQSGLGPATKTWAAQKIHRI
jgi:hypothetical protein